MSDTEWEVINSLLIIFVVIWCVHRIFILTKRIVKGWKGWDKK